MKTIKNALLVSSMVILSANAFASAAVYGDYSVRSNNKTIKTATVDNKETAYKIGFEKLNQLKAESGAALSNELALSLDSFKEKNSVILNDGAYITIQEFMNKQGNIVYQGLVNVTYSYSQAN
ncbi:MAG TPA: DUF3316 domain-containing protein [Psychromonas sp.]